MRKSHKMIATLAAAGLLGLLSLPGTVSAEDASAQATYKDIEQTLVRANFVLIPRFFIDMGRPIDREPLDPCRQRNGSRHPAASAPHSLNDFAHRLVQHAVVIGFQPNSNFLVHKSSSDLPSNLAIMPSATAAGTGS